jgi:hypothetical protein
MRNIHDRVARLEDARRAREPNRDPEELARDRRELVEEWIEGIEKIREHRRSGHPELRERSESFRNLVWRHASFYGPDERSPAALTAEIIRRIGDQMSPKDTSWLWIADMGDQFRELARAGTLDRLGEAFDLDLWKVRIGTLYDRDWSGVDPDLIPVICRETTDEVTP